MIRILTRVNELLFIGLDGGISVIAIMATMMPSGKYVCRPTLILIFNTLICNNYEGTAIIRRGEEKGFWYQTRLYPYKQR
jgi:hypothetical protein